MVTNLRPTFDVPLGRLRRIAPGLPTTDLARTVEHYARLGFSRLTPDTTPGFAILTRDGVELHFALKPDHDPATTAGWVHVTVDDADELAAEFVAAGMPQRREPHDTDHGTREFAHVDPDGNLVLFGSTPPMTRRAPVVTETRAPQPDAFEFARAIKRADVDRVRAFLAKDPTLATSLINSCPPLHLFADAPGHRRDAVAMIAALVDAGADLDAHAPDTWHHETALHWAASNDDVALIDALLDAGADIEHPGSSINGGPPSQSALGYGQWEALRRLYERGAKITLAQAAALGLVEKVASATHADPPPSRDDLSLACWNACRAGQLDTARYLAECGADLNWAAPWSRETALDVASAERHHDIVAWLRESGARAGH